MRIGLLLPAAAASVLLAACGSTSSQGAAAPAGSCAAAQQAFAGYAYSPSLGDVEVAANVLMGSDWSWTLTRMSWDPDTRAYVERRTKERLSKREVMRCLKRYIARELFPDLPRELLA